MNKNLYRIVFNKARGMLMVVADIARSGRASSARSSGIGHTHSRLIGKIGALSFSLWLAMGVVTPVHANIVADGSALPGQQPTLLQSANGTPQVNIQTPSAAGVSHNKYSQFDVSQQGVILNNSHRNVQTQLGGMVAGNPWLGKGEARVILNEVNSRDPSRLNGYVEVAGKQAQVVIANPSGITCNGCGFINANRATLTTGQPQLNNGALTGYNVERGEINIEGKGLDTSGANYTDIIARSVNVNAGIWGNELNVTTGRNLVDAAHERIDKTTDDPATRPEMALDVASLGGMYAGKIRMVGTESGVGVRNAGNIGAQAGSVTLTADGRIENSGNISGKGDTLLAASGGIDNSGAIYAGGSASVQSGGEVNNRGSIVARNHTRVQAASLTGNSQGILAAGVQDDGKLAAQGNLDLSASGQLAAHGQTLAGGALTARAQGIDLSGSKTQGDTVLLDAGSGELTTASAQVSARELAARSATRLNNDGGQVTADALSVQTNTLSNQKGRIVQTGSGNLTLDLPGDVNNNAGQIAANGNVALRARSLTNQSGQLIAAQNGSLSVDTGSVLDNRDGTMAASGTVRAQTGTLNNDGGLISASAGQSDIVSRGAVSNRKGRVESSGALTLNAASVDNTAGEMVASGATLQLNNGALNNQSGKLLAQGDMRVDSGALDNTAGLIQATGNTRIDTHGATLTNRNSGETGGISSSGTLTLATGDMDNQHGVMVSGGALDLTGNAVDNRNGLLGSEQAVTARVNTLNNGGGSLKSGGAMNLDAATLDNANGILGAGNDLTIHAGKLDNQQGVMVSGGGGAITAGTLDNRAGQLAAQQALTLGGDSINNDEGGLIQSGDAFTVEAGELTNRRSGDKGGITSLGEMTLTTGTFANNDGVTLAGKSLTLNSGTLDNTSGDLVATGALTLDLNGELNNQSGLMQGGSVALDTTGHAFTNLDGTLNSLGSLALNSGALNNQNGTLAAKGPFELSAASVDNRNGGRIIGESATTLESGALQNGGGQIQSVGDLMLDVAKGAIDNVSGLIRSGAQLTVNAVSFANQNTQDKNQGVEAASATFNTGTLNNQRGVILTDKALTITNGGLLDNTDGALASAGNLTLNGAKLDLLNTGGVAKAGERLDVDGWRIGGDGDLLSLGDMRLHSDSGLTNGGTIIANDTLHITTPGDIANSGKLLAGQQLDLQSGNLTNAESGEISAGKNSLNITGTLTNYGLIDGGYTRIDANTLTNQGTGRIYGDAIGINTVTFNNLAANGKAATLAGREWVGIATDTLNNRDHALIYSGGDMVIGGKLDDNGNVTGRAEVINNHSATIESAGNMWITAGQINNINDHFSTERVTVSQEQVTEYQHKGSPNRWNANDEGVYVNRKSADGLRNLNTPEDTGSNNDNFNQYEYQRTVEETRIKESDPAKILAGGNLILAGDQLFNDKSQVVAGGTLSTSGMANGVLNPDVPGERYTTDVGTVTHYYRIRHKGSDEQGRDRTDYKPPTVIQEILLKPGQLISKGDVQGSNITLAPLTLPATDVTIGEAGAVTGRVDAVSRAPWQQTVDDGEPVKPLPGQRFEVTPGDYAIRIVGPNTVLPDNSLFKINPSASGSYLVETDPRFTNEKLWLGSDYMQNALSQNGDGKLKRLGDGFYEQRLIREQVVELTGYRYLDGYTNDEDQFKALMDGGIAFGKKYALKLGVALTPEQMSLLTGDIVWLVNTDVKMPDGSMQTVLMPQVYAKVKPGDVSGSGSLIAGNNVVMKLDGDLFNRGTIAGRRVLQLDADNITNQSGMIQGADARIAARTDINNIGGVLQGTDSLLVSAGRDINATTTLRNAESVAGENRFTRTTIDSVSGIYVQGEDGKLGLKAGRDLNLTGAQVVASGDNAQAQLVAGRNITLNDVTTGRSDKLIWDADNTLSQSETRSVGSEVVGRGAVTLVAGNDIQAQGATVSSDQALTLNAGNDINLLAGQNTQHLDERHKVVGSSGWLSKTTTRTHDVVSGQTAQGSELSGNTVNVTAGRDLALRGGSIAGSGDVALLAGRDMTIGTAQERNEEMHLRQEKKSGLMSSGGIGFSVGSQSVKTTDTGANVTQAGSTVGSVNGDLTLGAGNRLAVTGSELVAGQDMTLTGKNVEITAAQNQNRQTHIVEQKTSGLTLALSGTAGSALNSVVTATQNAKSAGNSRLQALQGVSAALSGVQAAQAVRMDAAQGDVANNTNTVGVSLSWGSQSSKSTQQSGQTTAQGSTLNAGRNLLVQATGSGAPGTDGDLTIQGSQIKAGNNATLAANRDITLQSAENTQWLKGENESRGGSVGVGIGAGSGGWGINVSASVNKGSGNERGNGTRYTETTVDAGRQVTLISGRDTTLVGAQVNGETVKADVGRNLTLISQQDSDRYDSRQQNASAGGSFSFGSMSGSASASLSRDKMHSNYDSVVEQTGIFAGEGGYDIRVGEHTQLDGAVIGSTAGADKNRLDTGTLGFSDIQNRAEYKVEHQSVGFSTGGSIGSQFAGNLANSLLVGANHSGEADSTTRAALSDGTLIIRDRQNQQQDTALLSRDVEHANQTLSPIFDKEKEQNRLQQAQLIGQIGNQVSDIARTEGSIRATEAANAARENASAQDLLAAKAAWEKAHPGQTASSNDILGQVYQTAYNDALKASGFDTGGQYQRAIQAATAAVQGLAGGDIKAALAGGAAPYIAQAIGHRTDLSQEGKVAAHAVVNAALALAQGQNALAGAAGAATAEVVGLIANEMYGKRAEELSDSQKQVVSTLATLAAGLAGGLVDDSGASAISAAQAGKTTVENNLYGGTELSHEVKVRDHGADVLSCSDDPSGEACQRGIAANKAYAGALATGSVALLPGSAQAMWMLGFGANSGIQYWDTGEVNPVNAIVAGWVNVFTMGNGWKGTVGWNAAGGAFANALNGEDPLTGAITNGGGAWIGYGVGNYLIKPGVNAIGKWYTGGWDPKFNPTLLKYTEVTGQFGISKEMLPSQIPAAAGNIGGSVTSEYMGTVIQDKKEAMEKQLMEKK